MYEPSYSSDEKVGEEDPPAEQEEWAVARQTSTGEPFLEVSSFGNVRDYLGHVNHWSVNGNGYHNIGISPNRSTGVHRLVAKAFVLNPCPEIFDEVDHINGVRSDNRWTNLRWVTRKLNMMAVKGAKGWYKRPRNWDRRAKRWYTLKKPFRVQILDRMATPVRVVYNAYFETAETARTAYLKEKDRLFQQEYAELTGFDHGGIFPHKKQWYEALELSWRETMELCGPTSDEQGEVSS